MQILNCGLRCVSELHNARERRSGMTNYTIAFNSKVAEFIGAGQPSKMRIDASWQGKDGLRLRPTNRKSGAHVLIDLVPKGAKGLAIEIDEATLERLQTEGLPPNFLQPGERYSVLGDKYGWLVMLPGEEHETSIGMASVATKNR